MMLCKFLDDDDDGDIKVVCDVVVRTLFHLVLPDFFFLVYVQKITYSTIPVSNMTGIYYGYLLLTKKVNRKAKNMEFFLSFIIT